jgi:hypothetical protein
MILINEYDPPENLTSYHLSTFADIGSSLNDIFFKFLLFFFFYQLDADGELEHILPVCVNIDCSISQIYVRDNNKVKFKER